ncbi:dihydrolipoamide acetyltransferase family protein [Rhodohalobacter sp. 8-1]|uniref:dihydrolipoamide acetyltransferase family protein n=1 Tax=Rhodohalobacter sp. 8-1 TaxID=3131972 RepID=UPI0030EC9981
MAKEITLPKLSEDVDEGKVAEIMVEAGDSIEEDESIIAVESDKATVEVPCPESGTVEEIKVSAGDTIKTGDVILLLEVGESEEKEMEEDEDEDDEKVAEPDKKTEDKEPQEETEETEEKEEPGEPEEKKEKKAEEVEGEPEKEEPETEEIPAAPGAKRLAREHNVDLSEIDGSGPDGLITEGDVKKAAGLSNERRTPSTELPDFSKWGAVERAPLSNIRKATAKRTQVSWQEIPHVTQFDEAVVTQILEYIEEHQDAAKEKGGKLTITAVLTKLIATALHQFPTFNASIDMDKEEVILKKYIHIGIAADTDEGLLVPIVRDVDQKSIVEVAVEITNLAEKARGGQLSKEEMEGGNFIISNLGGIGGTQFTPIIYHPQAAILGVSEMKIKPVYNGDTFVPQKTLPLSLSYDHRLIDGAEGARFLRYVCDALEDPYKALLGE